MFQKCEELGEEKVREHLNANLWSNKTKRAHAQEWLRQLESSKSEDVLSRQEDRESESIRVAREANFIALSARDDARSAKKAAWIAAIMAIVATIIMIIGFIFKSPN
ncbi:MAG TPA: hypothetical protein VMW89_19565 [Desulfatiglandales bacterium]|nr:hypothetical protein [Desulfatiglandales bacterium]